MYRSLLPVLATLALTLSAWMPPSALSAQVGPGADHDHDDGAELIGRVHFATSCSPAAQQEFDHAVALLHSFWWQPAREAFTRVTQIDPTCTIAYWGIAMTWRDNPLAAPPSPPAVQSALAAIDRAETIGARTQRERDYLAAIAVLFRDSDTVPQRARALAYEQAMERLYLTYPDDREAAVFYALALNATALPTDKTFANTLQAAAILQEVFAEQPDHPGVAHYLIHSYDYPPLAQQGLDFAQRYGTLAPAVSHARHMPSHIFTRLGYWQESIQANAAAAAAAANDFDLLHAKDYLVYAYLQLGQDQQASGVLDEIRGFPRAADENIATAYAFAAMPARYALERGRWVDAAGLSLHPSGFTWSRFPEFEAITLFARAVGAARSGDAANASHDAERLAVLRDAVIARGDAYWAEQVDIQREVALAWIARAEGRNQEALAVLRAAAEREDATDKHPVTPGPIAPARELLGELLLELNAPGEALAAFEASQRVEPNRFRGLYGAARAAELAGDRERAQTYYAHLVALGEHADTVRPELQQARDYLAQR
jgi:hypothetical protein